MDSFYYWNYLRDKPISYFLYPLPVNIAWLFTEPRLMKDNRLQYLFNQMFYRDDEFE